VKSLDISDGCSLLVESHGQGKAFRGQLLAFIVKKVKPDKVDDVMEIPFFGQIDHSSRSAVVAQASDLTLVDGIQKTLDYPTMFNHLIGEYDRISLDWCLGDGEEITKDRASRKHIFNMGC